MITPSENFSGQTGTPEFLTIPDFRETVVAGHLTDEDGVGYYANEFKISSVKVVLREMFESDEPKRDESGNVLPNPHGPKTRMMNGTHVAWFPKQE